jgi:Holliday junction DNA helicase RuvA
MIASLHGVVDWIGEESLVVRVGGLGLRVWVTTGVINKLAELGREINLAAYLVVREDSLTLYGFSSEEEKTIFNLLMTVPGIGPRIALTALNTLSPEMLANAVQRDEPEVLARIPGVGKKTAQKIVLELKGKIIPSEMPAGLAAVSALDTEVIDALTAMGFSIVEAQAALQSIPRDAPDDIEERVRIALSYFSS